MTSYWNAVRPTIHRFDGRVLSVADFIACNWLHSGSGTRHIKYAYCVHPVLFNAVDDHWEYDDFWHEFVEIVQEPDRKEQPDDHTGT